MKKSGALLLLVLTALTGLIYPLLLTGIANLLVPDKAQGSLIYLGGKVVGSSLIGQKFKAHKYFWPRPSAADYNPLPSLGSNLSPTSRELKNLVKERKKSLMESHRSQDESEIPGDLVFASGSGLDPHISPAAAFFQIDRIIKARNFKEEEAKELKSIVNQYTQRKPKFFGPPTVNVLELNLELDKLSLYHPLVENSHSDDAKAPGLNRAKSVHISNISRLGAVQPRELSRGQNGNFQLEDGITHE